MTNAGKLKGLYLFQQRAPGDDGFGTADNSGDWATVFKAAGQQTALTRGATESVVNARLAGVQPFTVRIRYNVVSATVDSTWRAVDRLGKVYNITAIADPDGSGRWLDALMTTGQVT